MARIGSKRDRLLKTLSYRANWPKSSVRRGSRVRKTMAAESRRLLERKRTARAKG